MPSSRIAWYNDRLSTRTATLCASLLLAVFSVICWLTRAPGVMTRQDDARYIVLARALRAGSYRDIMWVGAPWHHQYPPGYPGLLALWEVFAGERFDSLIVLQILISALALWFAFDAMQRLLPRSMALTALALLAVNPWYIAWAGQVASEGSLALCTSIAVWAAVAMKPGHARTAVMMTAGVVGPYMRVVGLTLTISILLVWLLERRYREAALFTVVSIVTLGPLAWWILVDPNPIPGASYAGDLAVAAGGARHGVDLAHRLIANVSYYLSRGLPVLIAMPTIEGTIADNLLGTLVIVSGLAVGIIGGVRRVQLSAVILLASAALFLSWPYNDARFVVPLLPLLIPVLLAGTVTTLNLLRIPFAERIVLGMSILLWANSVHLAAVALRPVPGCVRGLATPLPACGDPDQASYLRAATFIRDSLSATERVLSARSVALYLYTQHPTAPLSRWSSRDSVSFWRGLHAEGTEFILLAALQYREFKVLAPRLAKRCENLELVATFPPRTYLFHVPSKPSPINTPTDSLSSAPACAALRSYLRTEPIP